MKFETIIFLVILFNVVTAFLQRRAKKNKEKLKAEAAAAASLQPSQPAPRLARTETRSSRTPEWDPEEEEADNEEHAHSSGWHDGEEGEEVPDPRSRQPLRPTPVAAPEQPSHHGGKTKDKAVTLGKSLLEQLAKELGLRIPKSEPDEIPYTPPTETPKFPAFSAHRAEENIHAPSATEMPKPEVASDRVKTHSYFGLNSRKMREAVVLREILDKPVSLRSGRFK